MTSSGNPAFCEDGVSEVDDSVLLTEETCLSDAFFNPAPPAPPLARIAASKPDLPLSGSVGSKLRPPVSISSSPSFGNSFILISGEGGGGDESEYGSTIKRNFITHCI